MKQPESEYDKLRQKLLASEEAYQVLARNSHDGLISIDSDMRIVAWNLAAEKMFGYTEGEMLGNQVSDIFPEKYRSIFESNLISGSGPLIDQELEIQGRGKAGKEIPIEIRTIKIKGGKPFFATIIVRDVTERMQMATMFFRLSSFPEQCPNPIIETDLSCKITYLNPIAKIHFPDLTTKGLDHPILKGLKSIVGSFKNKGREFVSREIVVNDLTYEQKICYVPKNELVRIFSYDITELKRIEGKLRSMTLVDELTNLYNRKGFLMLGQQQLKLAKRTKRGFMLLFTDVDDLKSINDTFGNNEGDRVLIEIARILKQTFRGSDIIARISADEFVVLAIEAREDSTEVLIDRLEKSLESRNAERQSNYQLSLSIGTAFLDPKHPCSVEELLTTAETTMRTKKNKTK